VTGARARGNTVAVATARERGSQGTQRGTKVGGVSLGSVQSTVALSTCSWFEQASGMP
jgi:hypothetical protein